MRALPAVTLATAVLASAFTDSCAPAASPAPSKQTPSPSLPLHVDGTDASLVRRSPDGSHVAVGLPPHVVDVTRAIVETDAGDWANGWGEVYVDASHHAQLWRPAKDLTALDDLGAAADAPHLAQDARAAVWAADGAIDVVDKASGATKSFATSGGVVDLEVIDGIALVRTDDRELLWTGSAEIAVSGNLSLGANERVIAYHDDTGEHVVDRATASSIDVDPGASVDVLADGRYVVVVGNKTATLVDGDVSTPICDVAPGTGDCVARGLFVLCAESIRRLDDTADQLDPPLLTAQPGGFFSSFEASSGGRAVLAFENPPGAVFATSYAAFFADGKSAGGGLQNGGSFDPPSFDAQETAVVFEGGAGKLAVNSDGHTGQIAHDAFHSGIEDDVFLANDDGDLAALDLVTMKDAHLSDHGTFPSAHATGERVVAVDENGSLVIFATVEGAPTLVDAGPYTAVVAAAGRIAVAADASGLVVVALPSP